MKDLKLEDFDFNPEYLPEHYKTLFHAFCEHVDAATAFNLLRDVSIELGGYDLYLGKWDSVLFSLIKPTVISRYNGYNARELSKEFGVCKKTIIAWARNE